MHAQLRQISDGGLSSALPGHRRDAFSAGAVLAGPSPYAVIVMKEPGINISDRKSGSVDEFRRMRS